ncbi:MAG: hypothetical protein ACFFBF_04250 [Promethearchaeota archaeon]
MINSKNLRKERILLMIVAILILSLLNLFLMNLNINRQVDLTIHNDDNNIDFQIRNLKNQNLDSDNTYNGIGAPWNVTHWANRTDYNLDVSFTNGSNGIAEIPLGIGWEGYKLNATIKNLYDNRNWCNGTFNFGSDNGYQTPPPSQDDSTAIPIIRNNPFQNWTFYGVDGPGYVNPFSGNYLNSSSPFSEGRDCLELRINGDKGGGTYYYEAEDGCWWNSTIKVPRGNIIDSKIQFDARLYHMITDFNDFELRYYINNVKVYSIGAFNLNESIGTSWGRITVPQSSWINSSKIWSNPLNDSSISIKIGLFGIWTGGYTGFLEGEYQQMFIDNVKLIIKAEAKPSGIRLKMNDLNVTDIDWGKGIVERNSNWSSTPVQANFTSADIWGLGSYNIELKTDLNFYARKGTPETNFETNTGSLGTSFSVNNNSMVNWECYSYFAVPTGYKEREMSLEFPTDVNITWVSEPQDPSINRLNLCDNSTQGLLIIPVDTISETPDGFWKFKALSPNYCEQITIYNNETGGWLQNNTFLSGDYINITGKITNSPLISGYIDQTKAQLYVRFPNGTIWTAQNQYKLLDTNGNIYFDYFQIPSLMPNYEVGEYEAIITWNNSYNPGLNETGVIYKKFTVIHQSKLIPDQTNFPDLFEGNIINIKVSFNDKVDNKAIRNAQVYVYDFMSEMQTFNEISPGYYLLEFNTTGGYAGDNIITIYANSSLYINNQVNVTIELIQATTLTAEEYPNIQVMWNENFTIHLNYTTKSSGMGISTIPTNNWIDSTYSVELSPGEYTIMCNTSAYEVNKFHSLIIYADAEGYESKNIIIGVLITNRQANVSVYIDSLKIQELDLVEKSFNDKLSVSVRISDTITKNYLPGEDLTLKCKDYLVNIPYSGDFWYNISLNCSPSIVTLGRNLIDISLEKDNYDLCIFPFQLFINQIEINIKPINFEDSLNAEIGQTINIQIKLLDPMTNNSIENVSVSYSWDYGLGTLNETDPGLFQTFIKLPENLRGNYKFNLIIIPENSTYKTMQYSFIVVIGEPIIGGSGFPNYLLWIIIGILISVASVLGALSLRSYVILPRRRKKEAELLSKAQKFKDLNNIQAIVIVHRLSGIPLFSKSYSILEKHKKELFSGFIQAITTIGEEFTEREVVTLDETESEKTYGIEKIIELDFKQFYCLIADVEDIRVVFILKEKSSERLKSQVSHLLLALNLKLSKELENWDGSLDDFEILIPQILNEYFELYYKDSFKLPDDLNLIKLKKDKSITIMEIRVINVIQSMSKENTIPNLNNIIELVHEENKDLIIVAIESLIRKGLILPK